MNKNALKNYAVWARAQLIESVKLKAYEYGITESGYGDERAESVNGRALSNAEAKQRAALVAKIKSKGYNQIIEEVAYTWFNRFIALRYMEVNGYLPSRIRVFSNENGAFEPEILKEAAYLDYADKDTVFEYIDNQDNEGLFKYLIIAQCNALNANLPGMFETINNYTELLFPNKLMSDDGVIAGMLSRIDETEWKDNIEIIGWLYQFYISEKHEAVIDPLHGKTISKEDVPAATQLFTTDWVVKYIVDNSLGRYWIERNPGSNLKSRLKYFIQPGDFEYVDEKVSPESITFYDPCMGSGHFLVYAFEVLMEIYLECGWNERDAVTSIVEKNLYGADIDDRAFQLAYFAVMMKAQSYDKRFIKRGAKHNLMSITESDDLKKLIYGVKIPDPESQDVLDYVLNAFINAKEYGSLIMTEDKNYGALLNYLDGGEHMGVISWESSALFNYADEVRVLIRQAQLLAKKYTVVDTNPPYMNKYDSHLKKYITDNFADYKGDMFSVFMRRNFESTTADGYMGYMTPNVWMFIQTYEKLRKYIIENKSISSLIQIAKGSFFKEATVDVLTFVLSNKKEKSGSYIRLEGFKGDMDYQETKALGAIRNKDCGYYFETDQSGFGKIPGYPIAYWVSENLLGKFGKTSLADSVRGSVGIKTGDNNLFLRLWWEVNGNGIDYTSSDVGSAVAKQAKWFPFNKGGEYRKWHGNEDYIINWYNDGATIKDYCRNSTHHCQEYADDLKFRPMITWSSVTSGKASFRYKGAGQLSDMSGISLFGDDAVLKGIMAFCNSNTAEKCLEFLAPTINIKLAPVLSMPYSDRYASKQITDITDECIALSKSDWDSFETSWNFARHPLV